MSKKAFQELKAVAFRVVIARIQYLNQFYGLAIGTVRIKNQTTRWGSCSKKGNLNFNYRLVHLSPELADYLIVHELCHIGEFNHSKAFWSLVARTIPNYVALRQQLRSIRL